MDLSIDRTITIIYINCINILIFVDHDSDDFFIHAGTIFKLKDYFGYFVVNIKIIDDFDDFHFPV